MLKHLLSRRRFIRRTIKDVLPKTLFARTLMIILTPLLLLQVATAIVFYDRHLDEVTRRLSAGLASEMAYLVQVYQGGLREPDGLVRFVDAQRTFDIIFNALPPEAWETLSPESTLYYAVQLKRTLRTRLNTSVRVVATNDETIVAFIKIPDGVLRLEVNRKRLFTPTSYIFLLWSLGLSCVLFSIALLFMRNQIRPLRRLARAAEVFGRGGDPGALQPAGSKEVRQATQAFNTMRSRVQRLVSSRALMLAAVSHDLRTPLARLRLNLDLLETPKNHDDLDAMRGDIRHMDGIITAYLNFAADAAPEASRTLDITALVREVAAGFPAVVVQADKTLWVQGRPVELRRCIENLLSNAQRYASSIKMVVVAVDSNIVLSIDDNGPGIPPDCYEEVFRPFARLDPARGEKTGGVGLGLAITRDIIHRHGGEIALGRSGLGGLLVMVTMPRTEARN
jgi:two-component system osmolarity sensor histidine kinase EnvZ